MTISDTISSVKFCIDHETRDDAHLADLGEDTYMDNIIRAKIPDAQRWLAIATAQCTSVSTAASASSGSASVPTVAPFQSYSDIGIVTLPLGITSANISRVRLSSWHKSAMPIPDTSDDALLMFDPSAKATADRPLATLMQGSPTKLLVQPFAASDSVEVAFVGVSSVIDASASDSTSVPIPSVHESAFVYYIAYLLLTAYQDPRAQSMLAIAVQMIGSKQPT